MADVFFDTNILIYALAQSDPRSDIAEALLDRGGRVSVQVLNEFVAVARGKLAMPWNEVEAALSDIRILCGAPLPLTGEIQDRAVGIARDHHLHIYDALIVAAASAAGCDTLYTEDMGHGSRLGGIHIRNPFVG